MDTRGDMPSTAPTAFYIESRGEMCGTSVSQPTILRLGSGSVLVGRGGQLRLKRGFDLVVSGLLLIVAMPVMVLIGVALAIEGRGPILFVQDRIGYRLQRFRVLKFRTLAVHSEGESVSRVLSRQDSRLTTLGRFLRERGLDELPQLVNVLGGSMSMVGPRPLVAEDAFACIEMCPERFSVAPGLTGLAQVSGRNGVPLAKRLQEDSEYVMHQSLWLDILILLKTLTVPFSPENAYPCEPTSRDTARGDR